MPLNKSIGNMYNFITHTWNTIKGECPHGCSYCYMKRWGKQPPLHFDEKELDTPPQEDKEYLFYFASKGERGMIISDTWERKRNNPYVIAWAEFQTLKV